MDLAPMWTPDADDVARAQLTEFARLAGARTGTDLTGYADLHRWSAADPAAFWGCIWDFFDVIGDRASDTVLAGAALPGAGWFPDARLNYVDQVFRDRPDDDVAIIEFDEVGREREVGWQQLREQVGALARTLREHGVRRGDRVAGYLPNGAPAVIAFLATAALGAIWSACGMDYAPSAALGRFAQLEPVVLLAADGYHNGGKVHDRAAAVAEVRAGLPGVRLTILLDRLGTGGEPTATDGATLSWTDALATPAALATTPVPFDHPLWVLFSSGTTGLPKGIVHGHGGVLLEHLKALALHFDLRAGDRFWWYTTPSWMMWNFQAAGLLVGATIVCYDGSPAHPAPDALWQHAARLRVSVLGTSPSYLAACAKAELVPGEQHDLSAVRVLGVTGSTLPAPSYHWIADNVGPHVQIASMTGGTDVVTAFAGAAPNLPVWPGEMSGPCLGVALAAFDEAGRPVQGAVGELVITAPMPSMPVMFWNDPDGSRYRDTYFTTFPGVWRHGDWVTVTDRGSLVVHGRSDATLNRNGIRMGSADIYQAVEQLPEITEALVVGIEEPGGGYWMPMFVTLRGGADLDDDLRARIRATIREHASPRHVPDEVYAAPAIPHTRTGKKLEVPIKRLLQGGAQEGAFDAGSVDEPSVIEWYLDVGRRHRSG